MEKRRKKLVSIYKFEKTPKKKREQLLKTPKLVLCAYTIGGIKSARGALSLGPTLAIFDFLCVFEKIVNGFVSFAGYDIEVHKSKFFWEKSKKAMQIWLDGMEDILVGISANISPAAQPAVSLLSYFCIKPNKKHS